MQVRMKITTGIFIWWGLSQIALHSQQIEVDGLVSYSANDGKITAESRFALKRNNDSWIINTVPIAGALRDPNVLYEEAGCDGTNIYYLKQGETNLPPNLANRNKFSPGLGRVQGMPFPLCFEINFFYPLWFSFCSSDYLNQRKDRKIVAPLFIPENSYTGPIPKPTIISASWDMDEPPFVSRCSWFSDGKSRVDNRDGSQQVDNYQPPFDQGFLQAEYKVSRWTNHSDLHIPIFANYKIFSPNYRSETNAGTNDIVCIYSISIVVTNVSGLTDFYAKPKLISRTLITDSRILTESGPISYNSTSTWESEVQIINKLKEKSSGNLTPGKAFRAARIAILAFIVGITGIFVRVLLKNRLKL